MYKETKPINEYLAEKGIPFQERNGELITHCIFNDCDKDSVGKEAHLYFSKSTGQYHCKKCMCKGNIITLAKYLGDSLSEVIFNIPTYGYTYREKKGGKVWKKRKYLKK